jgi:glycosyltransferase involved in cell wall biosynthesis
MCDIGDVASMAEKSISLLKDEESLNVFRRNAFLQAKRFDITEILPQYESYYLEIIEQVKSES